MKKESIVHAAHLVGTPPPEQEEKVGTELLDRITSFVDNRMEGDGYENLRNTIFSRLTVYRRRKQKD